MTILTRQERERLVLDLYNQGKTYREISKEARISPRDIGVILNKAVEEEEKTEELKEAEQDHVAENRGQEQQHLSLGARAYQLFSEGRIPIEVAIVLNLRESETTEFYKEYWKLNQLHNLNMVYEEIKDNIGYFPKLYKLAKTKGMEAKQVVDVLSIANNDLPSIEERFKILRNDVSTLQFRKHALERNLYQVKGQIATTTKLLNSFHISYGKKRREIENLHNEKAILEAIVTEFKNNNAEYLKLKQVAEQNVKSVLTNDKLLLQFAIGSVIESLRRNPELCNFVLNDISNNNTDITSYGSNYLSFISGRQGQQQSFNDLYSALILEEAGKLYTELTTKLTNEIIAAVAAMKAIRSLASQLRSSNNNSQNLDYENDNAYQILTT